ncbi:tetratricopeptide repeat protein [Akkermansiaceae bacterium]|nr:tetratricopeptide repeat protein [Akkermansiaceae bacterium]
MIFDLNRMKHVRFGIQISLGIIAMAALPDAFGQTFAEKRSAMSSSLETQSEAAILDLLKSGISEGKPTQAIAETRRWLRQNIPENITLLYQAGRAAELSGDARGAAALYQQYLKKADPKAASAGLAIVAAHTLLKDQLNDPGSAYSFNRSTLNRHAANDNARQLDQWFLAEAMKRKDAEAVARRLHALLKSGISEDLRSTFYDQYFRWLLEQSDVYVEQPGTVVVTNALVTACQQLAAAMDFNEELALQLDWAISVRAYNLAKLSEKNVAPPIAKATALLEKFPRYARWVQSGWAGGGNGRYYQGDVKKYWSHEIEAKLAPVVTAAGKISSVHYAELMESWRVGYYSHRELRPLEVKVVSDYVAANPKQMNSRAGVILLGKSWDQLTFEDLRALAPQLAQNSSYEASVIRAAVAGGKGKDFEKALAALVGPEAWRLPQHHDARNSLCLGQLSKYLGAKSSDQAKQQWADLGGGLKAVDAKKEDPAAQRLAAFRTLWSDYKSPQPKLPSVRERLLKVLAFTPEAIAHLLADGSVDAQLIARNALATGVVGPEPIWKELEATNKVNVTSYAPGILYLAKRHAGGPISELKRRYPLKCVAHPLEPVLREAVAKGLQQNKLEAWQVIAWVNMQYSEDNAAQMKLGQDLIKSPQWKTLPFEVHFAVRQWFGKEVITPAQAALVDAAGPAFLSQDLLALKKERETAEERKTREAAEKSDPEAAAATAAELAKADVAVAVPALKATLEKLRKAPVRVLLSEEALESLATLSPSVFSDEIVQGLLLQLIDEVKAIPPAARFGSLLFEAMSKNPDPLAIHQGTPFFWQHINRHTHNFPKIKALAQSLVEESPSAASALASAGLDAIARHRGHTYFNREVDIPFFKSIRGKAAMKMGLVEIPVPKADPAYPVYQSQADWITSNEESAWALLNENWEEFLPIHRELSMAYIKWALQRVIYSRDEGRQEELIKALMTWSGEPGSPLSIAEKIEIEISYGDIAMQRGQLREAHEIYSRTAKNEAYQDYPVRHRSTLRRARAERVAKDFDGALQTLNELELERVPELATQIKYARAEVYFDMEEFDDSADEIETILTIEPNHPDAKILLGKVQLKRQKLMEATEVELGSSSGQKSIVPGEKLKVTLNDPTLAVSGAGTEIEVVVWATSGDQEKFYLRQFGDQKTKFRGDLQTALGKPIEGDKTLQVIGDDEIFYAYSERFRTRMNNLPEQKGGPITVASDAVVMASARKLLSEAEQRLVDMEALMAELESKNIRNAEQVAKARMAAESLDAESRAKGAGEFQSRIARIVKPGNAINVRVTDPDRSRTGEVDELTVSVSSSSGDSISRVTLKETGTHTGRFEGRIPTTGAQAMAFAENSEPGRNPNMVISPNADYPAWRPVAIKDVTPEFKIDLNDNVALGEMTITAADESAKLKTFALQTGMNRGAMTTIGVFPNHLAAIENPWHPSVVVMNDTDRYHTHNGRSVYDLNELIEHMEFGWITQQHQAVATGNVVGPSEAMTAEIPGKVKWLRQDRHHNSHVVYRFRAYFYEPSNVTRRFKLNLGQFQVPEKTHPSVAHPPQFLLAVDGRPITNKEALDRLEGQINLRAGLHRFEIWATGWDCSIGFGRNVKLLANLEDSEGLVDCPDQFFNPESFPSGVLDHRNSPAKIVAGEDGKEFKVSFAPGSRTRLLNLVFLEQEGPVPVVDRIALNGPEGEKILPVAEDFAQLGKNEVLEILTSDKISVRYVDDRFVTENKEKQERFLDVAFTDARVEFADMEPRWSSRHGEERPFYEKLLRFSYDEPLTLAVHDADMDSTVEADTVQVSVQSETGGTKKLVATETGPSTGIFKAIIVPVAENAGGDQQIQVAEGGRLLAVYLDAENNRPGVPIERQGKVVHAGFQTPELLVGNAKAEFMARDEALKRGRNYWLVKSVLTSSEMVPDEGVSLIHGQMAYLELCASQLAMRSSSTVTMYAQSEAGRRAAGKGPNDEFDIQVPGTVSLNGVLSSRWTGNQWRELQDWRSRNYRGGGVEWGVSNPEADDRFRFSVPLVADVLPARGVLGEDERKELRKQIETSRSAARILEQLGGGLVVKPGEKVYFGVQYQDSEGNKKWKTTSATVITHPIFEVLDEDFQERVTTAYAGETLHLQVSDLGADLTDGSDLVSVLLQAKSGAKGRIDLRETAPHSGVFTGGYLLSYDKTPGSLPEDYNMARQGLPVAYGDMVAARYTDSNGVKTPIATVSISKGADGTIQPFSKQYEDPEVAMRTQFSLAEAYLEIAKRHRRLGETELAAREYKQAKQLLANAMEDFRDPDTRAHAEYLLGNLTLEEADTTETGELKEDRYRAALSRFMTVTGSYPETLHASRAQFRIATIYEKLKEPEIAAQEYVKLAYKYPDSEYLATSMARLGSHFLKKAAQYEAESKPLLEQEDDKDALFKGEALKKMASREYLKTAQIFSRMQERFPDHAMAGAAGLRAGQAYMRADKLPEAIGAFSMVINEENYDGKTIRSQAMYWSGKCHQDQNEQMAAYSIYKRLTYDFPESEWAAYARGELSQGSLLRLESELELERLEQE